MPLSRLTRPIRRFFCCFLTAAALVACGADGAKRGAEPGPTGNEDPSPMLSPADADAAVPPPAKKETKVDGAVPPPTRDAAISEESDARASEPAPADAQFASDATSTTPGQASDGGAFGMPRAGFTPLALTNLVFWLDAGKQITASNGKVAKWGDLGPNHLDAAQTNDARRPVVIDKALNGLPALRFKKSTLFIEDHPALNWGKGDFALILVGNYRNKPGIHLDGWAFFYHKIAPAKVDGQPEPAEVILSGNWPNGDTVPMVTKLTLSLNAHMVKCMTPDVGYNDGAFRVMTGLRRSGQMNLRINGRQVKSAGGGWNVDSVGQHAAIGTSSGGSFPLDGDIAEMIALKGTTSSEDLAALESYLAAKYGFVK